MPKGEWNLPERLCELSNNKQWPAALKEWGLEEVYFLKQGEDNDHCLCSHWIRQVCVIRNKQNNKVASVGNCCIKLIGKEDAPRFKKMHTVTNCLKRIKQDPSQAPNPALIDMAFRAQIITPWERTFCTDTAKKRSLTPKQLQTIASINRKILLGVTTSPKQALDNLRNNHSQSLNPKLIDEAEKKSVIRKTDAVFLKKVWAMPDQRLSDKQRSYKTDLTKKIANSSLSIG